MSEEKVAALVEDPKKAWQSRTVWINLIMAVVAILPVEGLQVFFETNNEAIPLFFAAVNMVLRLITKEPIVIK